MKQPIYAPIDWRTTPRPTQSVTVRLRIIQLIAVAFLALFFGGLSLIVLTSGHTTARSFIAPAVAWAVVLPIGFLLYESRQKAAREFNAGGVTRGDGRHFDWNDFRGVNVVTQRSAPSSTPTIWRVELCFDGGETASLIPKQVKNYNEVLAYVDTLPRVQPSGGAPSTP